MRCVIKKKNVQAQHYCNGCSINNTFPSENHILMSYRLLEVDKVKKKITTRDKILISSQPVLKLTTDYVFP
jgi:hypothetical protein